MKILVIRFSSLGDLVLTSPIFRELKRVYPSCHITLLTSVGFGSILADNPHIDEVIQHPRKESWQNLQQLIHNLKSHSFDIVYDAHRSLRSRWVCWRLTNWGLSGKPKMWKINKRGWTRNLLIYWKINLLEHALSQREYLLKPLSDHAPIPLNFNTELYPSHEIIKKIDRLLEQYQLTSKKFICIGPSASFPLKCWPVEYYQQLIEWLLKDEWGIVLVGGKHEKEPQILQQCFANKIYNVAGVLSPMESAELLKHAFVAVANDTSIGHMAEAMGTPAITIFGPTVREFGYAPFLKTSLLIESSLPLDCRPCTRNGKGACKHNENMICLTSIKPEQVYQSIQELISSAQQ